MSKLTKDDIINTSDDDVRVGVTEELREQIGSTTPTDSGLDIVKNDILIARHSSQSLSVEDSTSKPCQDIHTALTGGAGIVHLRAIECNRQGLILDICTHNIYATMDEIKDRTDEALLEQLDREKVNLRVTPFQVKKYIIGMSHAIETTISDVPADSVIVEIASVLNPMLGNVNNPLSKEFAKTILRANRMRIIATTPSDDIKYLFKLIKSNFDAFLDDSRV